MSCPSTRTTASTGSLRFLAGCKLDEPGIPGAPSCYTQQPEPSEKCCGCSDWIGFDPRHPSQPLPTETPCQKMNSAWLTNVLPKIEYLKEACPTAYSYQFDDKTATFNCRTTSEPNQVDYVVTYCPGGSDGVPGPLGTSVDEP